MQIFININHKKDLLMIPDDITSAELKVLIGEKYKIPIDKFRIKYMSRYLLEGNEKIKDKGVGDLSTIELYPVLPNPSCETCSKQKEQEEEKFE